MAYSQRIYKATLERLNAYMQAHDMRPSRTRQLVFDKLWELEQPFTAVQVVEACQNDKIATGSIYNNLEVFVLAQILQVAERQYGKNIAEYWLIRPTTQIQMKTICSKCGRITEFHDKAIEQIIKERAYGNFDPRQFMMMVYGECKVCRKKKK